MNSKNIVKLTDVLYTPNILLSKDIMYIPTHLYITQQQGELPCVQYTCHLSGKKQRINLCESLAQKDPSLFCTEYITRACLNIEESLYCIEKGNSSQQILVLQEAVPNNPSLDWQYAGSDGHNAYLTHPTWGVWILRNQEYLYLIGSSFSIQLEFQFYVQNNVLYLGISDELQRALREKADVSKPKAATSLSSEEVGAVVKYYKENALILQVLEEHIKVACLPSFELYTIPKKIPIVNNGHQLQILEFVDTTLRLPLLMQFINTQPFSDEGNALAFRDEREKLMRHILTFQFGALLEEAFQISKSIRLTWDCQIPTSSNPKKHLLSHYNMQITPGLKAIFDAQNLNESPSGLSISISKKSTKKYSCRLSYHGGQIENCYSFEDLITYINSTLEIQNLAFAEGHTVVWLDYAPH